MDSSLKADCIVSKYKGKEKEKEKETAEDKEDALLSEFSKLVLASPEQWDIGCETISVETLKKTLSTLQYAFDVNAFEYNSYEYMFEVRKLQITNVKEKFGSKLYKHVYPVPLRPVWDSAKEGTEIRNRDFFVRDYKWSEEISKSIGNIFRAFVNIYNSLDKISKCIIYLQVAGVTGSEVKINVYSEFWNTRL